MGYINNPDKFNDNTWLLDAVYKNLDGVMIKKGFAAYLIKTKGNENCLINPSSQSGAYSIYKTLKSLGAWPINKIIITHSHWDHTQGIVFFRERVKKDNVSPFEVYASEKAIPFLDDQSYNACFVIEEYYGSEYNNIEGVKPLKNKEILHIADDFSLRITEMPGHMVDHISLYDQQNNTLFVGDTIGMSWFPDFYICNSNNPYWRERDYLDSIKKIRSLEVDFLCIAHFGVFTGEDIPKFIDNSISTYYKWMEIFDQYSNKLDDPLFLTNILWKSNYKDFFYKPILKETLVNAVKNAVKYYKYRLKFNHIS